MENSCTDSNVSCVVVVYYEFHLYLPTSRLKSKKAHFCSASVLPELSTEVLR